MAAIARVVTKGALIAIAAIGAAAAAGACGDDPVVDSDGGASADASSDVTTTDGGSESSTDARPDVDAGSDADAGGPILRPCADVTFCDDFDSPTPLPRAWRAVGELNGGGLALADGGLVANVTGASVDLAEAILLFDADGGAAPSWDGRMAFAARVVGDGTLSGPRLLLAAEANGSDRRDVIVRFDASPAMTTASIDYFVLPCAECADPPAAKVRVGRDWHRYVLDVTAKPGGTKATGHGTLRLYVDGALAIDVPLGIPLSSVMIRTLDFGITQALDGARGTIFLDDAYLDLR